MKVLAVTGIRSEYDILFPVIDLLRDRKADVNVLVSGAHLSEHFGMTQSKIQDDNFVSLLSYRRKQKDTDILSGRPDSG